MFYRARLRLTLWYAAVLAVILIAFDVTLTSVLQRNLQDAIATDLQSKAAEAAAAVLDVQGGAPYFERNALGADPTWADVELYAATPSGSALQTVNQVAGSVLPEHVGLMSAFQGQARMGTVGEGVHGFMVYTRPVRAGPNGTGNVVAVVQVARSLRPVVDAIRRLVELLVAASVVAVLCAFAAGFWLAGKSLEPIRRNVVRQKEFVGDASHELRTPVTVIRTAAESILRQREPTSERVRALAQDIVSEADQLARMVEDLGTMAQADARRLQMQMAEVEVPALLDEVAQSGALLAEAGGVRLACQVAAAGRLRGDAPRLRQLFLILLDNAVKFSAPGTEVRLQATTTGNELGVRVIDDGVGIASAEVPRIFERFFRGEAARQQEGSGLGLAIAQLIVEQHGGRISVRSQEGRGSEFEVFLPLLAGSSGEAGVRMTAQKLHRRAEVVK